VCSSDLTYTVGSPPVTVKELVDNADIKDKDGVVISSIRTVRTGSLFEYRLSGGKISSIPSDTTQTQVNVYDEVAGVKLLKATINPAGSILTVAGQANRLIDSGVVVYVKDANDDYSVGNIKDLLDKEFGSDFEYIADDTGKVKALLVSASDTGAQSVYVMVTSVSKGSSTGGDYSVVSGLSFADGAAAAIKSWDFVNDELPVTDQWSTPYTAPYTSMLKFSIGADGVLKSYSVLSAAADGDPITGAHYVKRTGGTSGTFQVTYTTNSALTDIAAFESNAVLYKIDGRTWKAYKPAAENFSTSETYTFLKTDKDKGYDVIIGR
jgi:hypothetical protein